MIPILYPALLTRAWIRQFKKILKTRWIGQGPMVDKFEKEFGEKWGDEYCVSVNSGTSALEIAYQLAGIKKGDKVCTPVFTCTATNIPLVRIGAKLEFIDINPKTWTMDAVDLAHKVNGAKAIVAVNLGGIPISDSIIKLAKEKKIPLIIDAAQSLGIEEPRGDYVCYSFQAIKHFTTGDGGMLVVRNKKDYERAKRLRWFGIDREAKKKNNWKPYKNREMIMDIKEPGYKFQMNDIAASMGIVGLKCSDKILKHRAKIARIYKEGILSEVHKVAAGSYWLFGLQVKNRDKFCKALEYYGVETNVAHLRNDIFKVFGGKRKDLPNMKAIENRYIYIPLNTKVSVAKAKYIVKVINLVLSYENCSGNYSEFRDKVLESYTHYSKM